MVLFCHGLSVELSIHRLFCVERSDGFLILGDFGLGLDVAGSISSLNFSEISDCPEIRPRETGYFKTRFFQDLGQDLVGERTENVQDSRESKKHLITYISTH
jgi:hypothetical protein